jgi:hypothetical protein
VTGAVACQAAIGVAIAIGAAALVLAYKNIAMRLEVLEQERALERKLELLRTELIVAMGQQRHGPPFADISLGQLRVSELKGRARAAGVSEEQIDAADDSADVRAALIGLVDGTGAGDARHAQPLARLQGMTPSLIRRSSAAAAAGVHVQQSGDAAYDMKNMPTVPVEAEATGRATRFQPVVARARSSPAQVLSIGGEQSCSMLLSTFQCAVEVVESLLTARRVTPTAGSRSSPQAGLARVTRQALMVLMDRLEQVSEGIDLEWCDGLRKSSVDELNTLAANIEAAETLTPADGHDRVEATLSTLLHSVHRCSSVVVQSTCVLAKVGIGEDTRLCALETLRSLPQERLTEPSQEELAAFSMVAGFMSLGSRDESCTERPGQVAAAMATFTLGCRNGADACAVPEMLAHTGELWVRGLKSLLTSMDDLGVASAVLSVVALLHAETPAKVPQSVRAPLEKENLSCAKNAFAIMGKELTVARSTEIVKTMLDQNMLAQQDVSLSCGAAYFAAFLLAAKLDAVEPCNESHLFRDVLALYRRVCPQDLPAEWWAADGSVISNTSTRLVGVGFLAQHSKSVTDRMETSWWEPMLRSAVNMVKVNASAQLCAQDTMSFWPILSSLGIVEAAAKDLSQQKLLLDLGVDEALEYACVNDFTLTGRSIANVAAGAMVALVGRNEGGTTLNKDTVDAVLNFLVLYFQADHPAFHRPATTVILPLTTVVTMAISDVNK